MKKTSDNSYEFHKNSSLNTFFISKEKKQIHPWSIKGIHIHLSSKFAIVCSGKGDINKYLFHGNYVNLWHGSPIKKILLENKKVGFPFLNTFRAYTQPWNSEFYKIHVTSMGEIWDPILSKSFGISNSKILPFGYPRNDCFSNSRVVKNRFIYMPTWRDTGRFKLKDALGELSQLNSNLKKRNIELYISAHPTLEMELANYSNIKKVPKTSNINEFLFTCQLLISDYSGAVIDFMLTSRRIVLNLFDYKDYINLCRELNFKKTQLEENFECVYSPQELSNHLFHKTHNETRYVKNSKSFIGYQKRSSTEKIDKWLTNNLII
jgi:CDP-glycerol glycerophosphotransferase (TagB/SpsB family)